MKGIVTILLLIFTVSNVFGRLTTRIAIINDKDGYTNVREKPTIESEIIYKLNDWEAFEIDIEYIDLNSEWIKIRIPKNKLSKLDGNPENYSMSGYIHKSRIKLIDSLTVVENPVIELDFDITKADTNKIIDDKNFTIDGHIPFGLEVPLSMSYEIRNLYLVWNGERTKLDTELYDDLYNVTFKEGNYNSKENRFKTYKNNGTYYIRQDCADGAGFYWIVWIINEGKIKQRIVVELT